MYLLLNRTIYSFCFLLLLSTTASAQINLKGIVLSDDRQPLPGAGISLKGNAKGVAADAEGHFTLSLTDAESRTGILLFSASGYFAKEVGVRGRSSIEVILGRNPRELSEVIVTNAYAGPRRREEVVGSISTVTNRELQTARPLETFDKMLEGLVAGVYVEPSSELGTPVKVNIRGQNSLTNLSGVNRTALTTSSQPLYVVDGVPIVEQRRGDESIAFLSSEQLLNPLSGINPDDIESISVLKDAAATAIYGANASNGVVIITTKRGRAGATKASVGWTSGWGRSINRMQFLTGPKYYTLANELYRNEGISPFDATLLSGSPTINTPWFELINRYSRFTNIDASISGGNANTQFFVSASYLDQQSIQKGNDFHKAYFRLRLDQALSKRLQMTVSLAPTLTRKKALNLYGNVPIQPNTPVYNADGSFYELGNLGVPNPLAVLAQNRAQHAGGSLNGNVRFNWKLTPEFSLSTTLGTDLLINKLNLFESGQNATGRTKGGFAEIYDRTNTSWVSFTQAAWAPRWKDHSLDVTAGFEARGESTELLRGTGSGFTYYRLNELSNAANQSSASSKQKGSAYSMYGSAQWGWLSRYFVNASMRYDAASIFGTDVNTTVNPAIGLGWVVSKEQFMQNVRWLEMLRLRASYGTTGNSRIGSYESRGLYTFNDNGYNGFVTSRFETAPNPDLGWEKANKFNTGLDMAFGKRFGLTFDFYNNVTHDAISLVNVPVENGFAEVLANVATLRNRGWDAQLTAKWLTRNFTWSTILNAGFNRNVVLEVADNRERFSSPEGASVLREGVSTSAIWGFRFAGVDPQTGKETFFNPSGRAVTADALDRSPTNASFLGDRLPSLQGGLINNLGYKGVELSFIINYNLGGEQLVSHILANNVRNLNNVNQTVNLLDRWQKPGDITTVPRLDRNNILVTNSSKLVYDATYVKLGNLSLAYKLPRSITSRLRGAQLTVFAQGTNLAYWYKDKSPEGRNGIREYRFRFPEAQSFTWGARLGF